MRTHWRFIIVTALLAATALLMEGRRGSEIILSHLALRSFPETLGSWVGTDIAIPQDTLDVLGPGDFLLRDYRNPAYNAGLGLFIAYFPSQRTGDTIHSPKHCLPGAGWEPIQSDRISVNLPGIGTIPANRYLLAKGEERQLVLYWYWAHGRAVASEYAAKFYLVSDSIRMHRSDGSLIRVSMGLAPHQDVESVQRVMVAFAGNVVAQIDGYIPR
jgi:EpsI family protein